MNCDHHLLGNCPAVDFETKMYAESLDVLEHQIKPLRRVPGVVLEQAYLNKMSEGLKPLEMLVNARGECYRFYITYVMKKSSKRQNFKLHLFISMNL